MYICIYVYIYTHTHLEALKANYSGPPQYALYISACPHWKHATDGDWGDDEV